MEYHGDPFLSVHSASKRKNIHFFQCTILDGFFAHEAQSVVPEAVTGTKDQVANADDVTDGLASAVGDAVYQGIDHSKFVPLLTAALQEAVAKIETLEAEVAALKAKVG